MNEKEAIERLNRFKTIKVLYGNTFSMHLKQLEQLQNDIETGLNLLEKKDKMIKYMANFINDNTPYTKDTRILENERGVRNTKYTEKYFERKVENEN